MARKYYPHHPIINLQHFVDDEAEWYQINLERNKYVMKHKSALLNMPVKVLNVYIKKDMWACKKVGQY